MTRRPIFAAALALGLFTAQSRAQQPATPTPPQNARDTARYLGLPRWQVGPTFGIARSFDGAHAVERLGLGFSMLTGRRLGVEGDLYFHWIDQATAVEPQRTRYFGGRLLATVDIGGPTEALRFGLYGGGGLVGLVDTPSQSASASLLFSGFGGLEARAGWPHVAATVRAGVEVFAHTDGVSPVGATLGTELRIGLGGGRVVVSEPDEPDEQPLAATTLYERLCGDFGADFGAACPLAQGTNSTIRSLVPAYRAGFPTTWGALTIRPFEGDTEPPDEHHPLRDIAPSHCAMVLAQATGHEPAQDLDLRVVDEHELIVTADEAGDDWPVAFVCNFGERPLPLRRRLQGRYVGAPEGVREGVAALVRVDFRMPRAYPPVIASAQPPEIVAPLHVPECVGAQLDGYTCGVHILSGEERQFTVSTEGTFCYTAPALSGVAVSRHAATPDAPADVTRSHAGWSTPICEHVPEQQGAWRYALHAEGIGGPVVLAHFPDPAAVDRVHRTLARALGVDDASFEAMSRDNGPMPRGAVNAASEGAPLTIEGLEVPRFATLEVRAVTAHDGVGAVTLSVRQGERELATHRETTGGTEHPRRVTWLNDSADHQTVSARGAPHERDRTALQARLILPSWQVTEGATVTLEEAALRDLRECQVDHGTLGGTGPDSGPEPGHACYLRGTTESPREVRVQVGATLCFASRQAPKLVHNHISSDADRLTLDDHLTDTTHAPCEEIRRTAGQTRGDVSLSVTAPTLVYRPLASTRRRATAAAASNPPPRR